MKKLHLYLIILAFLLTLMGCTSDMGNEVNSTIEVEKSEVEQSDSIAEADMETKNSKVEEDNFVIDYEEVENIIINYLDAQLKRDYDKMAGMLWDESHVAFGYDDPNDAMKAQEVEHKESNYEMVSYIMGDIFEEESEFYPETKFVGGHFEERRFLNGQEYVLEYNYIRLAYDEHLGWRVCYKKYLGTKGLNYDQTKINYPKKDNVPTIKIGLDKILYNNHEAYFMLNIIVHEDEKRPDGIQFSIDEDHQTILVVDTNKDDWKGKVQNIALTHGNNEIIVPVKSILSRYEIKNIRIENIYYQSEENSEPIPYDFIIFDQGEYIPEQLIQSN